MPGRQTLRARLKQMATWHSEILITTAPLESRPNIWNGRAGASVDFWGVVRGLEDGREISGIEYEAHETMAQHQMEMIARAAQTEFELEEIHSAASHWLRGGGRGVALPAGGERASRGRLSGQRLDRGRTEAKSADLEASYFR